MNATRLLARSAWSGVILTSLLLSSCQGAKETMKQAGDGMGDAAKQAAGDAASTAMTPALAPLMDLLNKGESQIKAGDLQAAMATMGGFEGVLQEGGTPDPAPGRRQVARHRGRRPAGDQHLRRLHSSQRRERQ